MTEVYSTDKVLASDILVLKNKFSFSYS